MENSLQDQQDYLAAKEHVKKMKGFYTHLTAYIVVNIFIIWGSFYDRPFTLNQFFKFETFATPFFWGIGLVSHWAGVFGKNIFFGRAWEKRKIDEFMDKQK